MYITYSKRGNIYKVVIVGDRKFNVEKKSFIELLRKHGRDEGSIAGSLGGVEPSDINRLTAV